MTSEEPRRYYVGDVDVTEHVRAIVDRAPPPSPELIAKLRIVLGLGPGKSQSPTDVRPATTLETSEPVVVEYFLYRWYDSDDVLLYIGITDNPRSRRRDHEDRSTWTQFAARHEVSEPYPDRAAVAAAERDAIAQERPVFNVQHAGPDASARMVTYLIDHGRVDLLAPKLGRG